MFSWRLADDRSVDDRIARIIIRVVVVVDVHIEVAQVKLCRCRAILNTERPVIVIGDEFLVIGPLHPLLNVFQPSFSVTTWEIGIRITYRNTSLRLVDWTACTEDRCENCKLTSPIFTVKRAISAICREKGEQLLPEGSKVGIWLVFFGLGQERFKNFFEDGLPVVIPGLKILHHSRSQCQVELFIHIVTEELFGGLGRSFVIFPFIIGEKNSPELTRWRVANRPVLAGLKISQATCGRLWKVCATWHRASCQVD